MKTTLFYLAVPCVVLLNSCTQLNNDLNALSGSLNKLLAVPGTTSSSKPTLVKLNNTQVQYQQVSLRWSGATPSMNIDSSWVSGSRQSAGVYSFGKDKFYDLTLDFNRKTFVETGYDGTWLPEVKGSWTAIR